MYQMTGIFSLTSKTSWRFYVIRKANNVTGLKAVSEIEIDKITTIRISRLSEKIGEVAEKELNKINYTLRVWLDI